MHGLLPIGEMTKLGARRQPWVAPSLPPRLLSVPDFRQLRFVHHTTTETPGTDRHSPFGSTIWIATTRKGCCIAIAFDWRDVLDGVLALNNPLAIASNAIFLDEEGQPLEDLERMTILLQAVTALPWQVTVREHLASTPTV